jgi:heme exporter protein D
MGKAVGNLSMRFDTFAEFLQMGGHGPYVWAAYGFTLVVVTANLWWPGLRLRKLVREERRVLQRNESGRQL